jgi:hypothetical protein
VECVQGPARPFKHDMSSPLTGLRRGLIELRLSLRSVSPTQKKRRRMWSRFCCHCQRARMRRKNHKTDTNNLLLPPFRCYCASSPSPSPSIFKYLKQHLAPVSGATKMINILFSSSSSSPESKKRAVLALASFIRLRSRQCDAFFTESI